MRVLGPGVKHHPRSSDQVGPVQSRIKLRISLAILRNLLHWRRDMFICITHLCTIDYKWRLIRAGHSCSQDHECLWISECKLSMKPVSMYTWYVLHTHTYIYIYNIQVTNWCWCLYQLPDWIHSSVVVTAPNKLRMPMCNECLTSNSWLLSLSGGTSRNS